MANVDCALTVAEDVRFYTTDAGPNQQERGPLLRLSIQNPFTPAGSVIVNVLRPADVRIEVYDVAGRRVRSLHPGLLGAGRHALRWDAKSDDGKVLPGGIYLLKAHVGGEGAVRKVVLIH